MRAEFAEKYHGANVKVTFTVPKSSTGATVELAPGASKEGKVCVAVGSGGGFIGSWLALDL